MVVLAGRGAVRMWRDERLIALMVQLRARDEAAFDALILFLERVVHKK